MLLFRTTSGPVIEAEGRYCSVDMAWNDLINHGDIFEFLTSALCRTGESGPNRYLRGHLLAPLDSQEVWAAGVTYFRSRTARMEESQESGGGDLYDRVYAADRPELFLKATPHRVVGTGQAMKLRRDSKWIVPEPELVLVVNSRAQIIGYTVGNDLSCRDIEGENPLYLPQAKTFDRCAAIGPGILVSATPPSKETQVHLTIFREGNLVFHDSTTLAQIKRSLQELVDWLFTENSHPYGCLLMTGTGIVPSNDFSLQIGDVVEISIDGIGLLVNPMD